MKVFDNKHLFLAFLQFWSQLISAQNRTNIWQLGENGIGSNPTYYLDFSSGILDTVNLFRKMNFFITNASICNATGELLFYTNGVWIANRNHDTLYDSQDFNPGYWTDYYGDVGMGIPQGCLFLPSDVGNKYYLFHVSGEYGEFYNQTFSTLRLGESILDLNLDLGLGAVVPGSKNLTIISDTLEWGRLTACRHANGRDWWIITHKFHSDIYYKVLQLPDSINIYSQNIGNEFNSFNSNGMAVFSSDGSKYAHLNVNDTIDLLNFDRCSGEFYNFVELSVPDTSTFSGTLSCSFSPNNRFLYVSTYWSLYQFDTWANDIQMSIIKVGSWEDQNGWPDFFLLHQLAPDGKIYISLWGANNWMHVINEPDSIGSLCNFIQHGVTLPQTDDNFSVPNFPNYDLGTLQGSPCDTLYLGINAQNENLHSFRISPNPASDFFNIVYKTDHEIIATITNEIGHELQRFTLYPWFKNRIVYTDKLAPGIYLLTFTGKDLRESKKLIIQH